MPAFYSIALLIAFYALVVAEILLPSGGLLAISAVVVAITSVIIACTYSLSLGLTLTLIYLVTTPILFALLVHLWPKTKIGRMMLNRDTLQSDTSPLPPTTADGTPLADFIGKFGVAVTHLLPGGQVKIEGHKTDVVSTGLPIDAGSTIVVTRIVSGKLHVRLANEDERARFQMLKTSDTSNGAIGPVAAQQPVFDNEIAMPAVVGSPAKPREPLTPGATELIQQASPAAGTDAELPALSALEDINLDQLSLDEIEMEGLDTAAIDRSEESPKP